jgi:hypothetical protein
VHLLQYVESAYQVSVYEELREGRPVRKGLKTLSNLLIKKKKIKNLLFTQKSPLFP